MKKIIILLALLLLLAACGRTDESREVQYPADDTETEIPAENGDAAVENENAAIEAQSPTEEPIGLFYNEPGFTAAKEFLGGYTAMFLEWREVGVYIANHFGLEFEDTWQAWQAVMARILEIVDPDLWRVDDELVPDALLGDHSFGSGIMTVTTLPHFWDIYESGFPLIGYRRFLMFANGGPVPTHFYYFADSGYTYVGTIEMYGSNFYRDADGRLFVLTGFWPEELEKAFFSITDSGIHTEPSEIIWTIDDFMEMDFDVYLVPGVPYAEITIIPHMGDFFDEIFQALRPEALARFEASFALNP